MADEITLTAALEYSDSENADLTLALPTDVQVTVSTKKFVHAKQNIGLSEEAIGLGEVTSLGWAIFINRDATNFINIKTGTGGTIIMKIPAGKCAGPFHF